MSTAFRRMAANALADAIAQRVQLKDAPTVISAPPSSVADYPAVAIWLEHHALRFAQEDELMVDSVGAPLIGSNAKLGLQHVAGPARVDERRRLSRVGTISSTGRIWVGCRLPARREETESKIVDLFMGESIGIGNLALEIAKPTLDGIQLAWSWTAYASIGDSEWVDEFAFSERLWSWIKFDLDAEILVARATPETRRLLLALDGYFQSPSTTNPEYVNQINIDGSITTPAP